MSGHKFNLFLSLLEELRLDFHRQTITARMHMFIYGPKVTRFSCVSKYVYSLTTPTYYGENVLSLLRARFTSNKQNLFRLLNFAIGHHVRNLEIHIPLRHKLNTLERLFEYEPSEPGNRTISYSKTSKATV